MLVRGRLMKKGIISVLSVLIGGAIGAFTIGKMTYEKIDKTQAMSDKHFALFLLMNQWVKVQQEGKSIADYFDSQGYKEIAVYGMSYAGETLIRELKNTNIHVAYGIDKNAESIYADVDVISMNEEFENVDVVVVTAITFFDEIKEELAGKIECPIVSLEDILYGM